MATFTKRTAANAEDIQESYNGSTWFYSESSIYMGYDGSWTRELGLRFTNITVPQGSTITSAKITFESAGFTSKTVNLKIKGIDVDACDAFTSGDTPRTRAHTTSQIDWDESSYTVSSGTTFDSDDITSVVQEIVNRGGWSSGNDMGFYIANDGTTNGLLEVNEYEDGSAKGALLTINYDTITTSTSTSTSTTTTTTSTSSTTTSTSITTTSTLRYIPPKDIGFKISRPGVDAKSVNPNDFLLWSKYPQLQVYKTGQFSWNFTNESYMNIDHDLGYKPFAIGFMQWYDGVADEIKTDYRMLDWSIEGAGYLHYSRMEITKTQLKFYLEDSLLDKVVTLKGYYIIFYNPIDESDR